RGGRPRRAWSSSGGRGGSLGAANGDLGDQRRERCAVEAVEPERFVGGPARGPALDAEDGDDAARERGAEAVAQAPDRRVVLEDEEVLERRNLGRPTVCVAAAE